MVLVETRAARTAIGVVLAMVVAAVRPAAAQAGIERYELSVGPVVVGTMPVGDSDATLVRPDGAPFPFFRNDVTLGPGPGLEAHFGRSLGARLSVEATGAWTFTEIRTKVSGDAENAPDVTLTEDLSRFSVEGSVLWRVAGDRRRSLSIRGGAGWMRELAGDATLAENGVIGNLGAAVKYWWGPSSSIQRRRLGLRLDGRAVLRSGGVELGSSGVHVAPAASADLMIGF
jgi:hypothetical protein